MCCLGDVAGVRIPKLTRLGGLILTLWATSPPDLSLAFVVSAGNSLTNLLLLLWPFAAIDALGANRLLALCVLAFDFKEIKPKLFFMEFPVAVPDELVLLAVVFVPLAAV